MLCLHIHPNKWLIGPNGNYFVYINFHIGLYPDLSLAGMYSSMLYRQQRVRVVLG